MREYFLYWPFARRASDRANRALTASVLHDTGFIYRPFAIFNVGTLIMLLLTFSHANFHLAPGVLPVQGQSDDGIAVPANAAEEVIQLALVQQ